MKALLIDLGGNDIGNSLLYHMTFAIEALNWVFCKLVKHFTTFIMAIFR
jgi:hypothetical protein